MMLRLLEQELPNFLQHLSSSPVFSGVRVVIIIILLMQYTKKCTIALDISVLPEVVSIALDINHSIGYQS